MKRLANPTNSVWGTFHVPNCPAGCTTCSAEKDRFAAKFTRTVLSEAQTLPAAYYRSHRILFLLSGHVHVRIGRSGSYYLTDRQCIFLARKRDISVLALRESEMVILEFNNRIILCHNDILARIATRDAPGKVLSPVLPIVPEVLSFFRDWGRRSNPKDYTCPVIMSSRNTSSF